MPMESDLRPHLHEAESHIQLKSESQKTPADKLDFVGFGALNVDYIYLLRPNIELSQIVPGLVPGGEVVAHLFPFCLNPEFP